ncbi:MAG: hypothetical protein ABIJ59_20360 [Pseudomonadota bacterium]
MPKNRTGFSLRTKLILTLTVMALVPLFFVNLITKTVNNTKMPDDTQSRIARQYSCQTDSILQPSIRAQIDTGPCSTHS